jgi:transposase
MAVSDLHHYSREPSLPMLTREDDVDAHALHRRGWTISAIARHLGHDRKTMRAYLPGRRRVVGDRKPAGGDPFEPFVDYVRARFEEGPASVGGDVVRRGRRPRPTY